MDGSAVRVVTTHVIALSGGKDSTAMALRLIELNPCIDYQMVCTPTGDELPEMVAHWARIRDITGRKLQVVTSGRSLVSQILRSTHIPNPRQRWCTRQLKIEPYAKYLSGLRERGPVVSYVGLRADEPEREGGDYSAVGGVESRYPLRDWGWGLREVMGYLRARDVTVPKRTDCARCFFQRLSEWWDLWDEHSDIFEDAAKMEEDVSAARGKPCTLRSDSRDSWPASLRELGKRFENGEVPRGGGRRLFEQTRCRVCRI